jgi:hypothetical protein
LLCIEETGEEELVPGVLEAGQAPVHAVSITGWVGELLRSEGLPLLLVDGGVCILAVCRQLGYVEEGHRHVVPVLLQNVGDNAHDALPAVGAPVGRVVDHLRLVVAVAPRRCTPILAPACILYTNN